MSIFKSTKRAFAARPFLAHMCSFSHIPSPAMATPAAQAIAILDRVVSPECSSWITNTVTLPGLSPAKPTYDMLCALAELLYDPPPALEFGGADIEVPPDLAEIANSLEDGGLRGYIGTGATPPGCRLDTGTEAAELARRLFKRGDFGFTG